MKILASGITRVLDGFLHAGYVSAYPRTQSSHSFENNDPFLQLDVKEALRLKGESFSQAPTGGGGASPLNPLDPGHPLLASISEANAWITLFIGVGAFFLLVALISRIRSKTQASFQAFLVGSITLTAGIAFAFMADRPQISAERISTIKRKEMKSRTAPPPWQGVELREYAHPEDATKALLYGLIADGIANMRVQVSNLAQIQDEVAFPTIRPTEGMRYALKTYGIDGWGNGFQLAGNGSECRVISAGPDGELASEDDIVLSVKRTNESDWDGSRWAHFIRKENGETQVFFHRWTGRRFRYHDYGKAVSLTGGDVFDVVYKGMARSEGHFDFSNWDLQKAVHAWDRFAEKAEHEPLVLHVIRPS